MARVILPHRQTIKQTKMHGPLVDVTIVKGNFRESLQCGESKKTPSNPGKRKTLNGPMIRQQDSERVETGERSGLRLVKWSKQTESRVFNIAAYTTQSLGHLMKQRPLAPR